MTGTADPTLFIQPTACRQFVLLTHSTWSEPPRLRHQIARLLLSHGHKVTFFERAGFGLPAKSVSKAEDGLTLVGSKKLIHAQLRVLPVLHELNRVFVSRQLRSYRRSGLLGEAPCIINFNFDYYFLRDVFSDLPIVTIINDDFEAQARLPFNTHLTWALERTCQASNRVLALSESLRRRLAPLCPDTRLFLPWAVTPYVAPIAPVTCRNTLLFWGTIDSAIDLNVLQRTAHELARARPGSRILLVGPLATRFKAALKRVMAVTGNIELQGPTPLEALPFEQVIAAIIPYGRHPAQNAITLANKSFQLISRGIPLLISGMPDFLTLPFVLRLDDGATMQEILLKIDDNFASWQGAMAEFIAANPPESRLGPLCEGI